MTWHCTSRKSSHRALPLLLLLGCRSTPAPAPALPAPDDRARAADAATANQPADALGSLRGARIAIARGPDRPQLTYFAESMPDELVRELRQLAPGVRIVVGLSQAEALARAAEAHGADAAYATPEFVGAATNLVWVQAGSAGVERHLANAQLAAADRIVLTNARGIHGPAIADHAFAMLLALTRDLAVHLAARARGEWRRDGSGVLEPVALQGRTLLVVGLGGIGSEIARRGHGFGMRVIAIRRGDAPAPAYVEQVGKPDRLLALLPQADVVAIAVPLTRETEHLFGADALAAMKPGSHLINIARGRIVDTAALVAALRNGQLAGACLDVTDPEPLPAEHPLWQFPNVVITPHVSGRSRLTQERARALARENMRRFDAGEPLLNVVDKSAGY